MIPQSKNASLQSIRREVDFAWLAGIVDGEGNFVVSTKKAGNGKDYFMPKIRIANTDVRMIEKIAKIYVSEGYVFFYTINKRKRYNGNWKDQLHIEIASQGTSKKLLESIIPYLVNKKKLAEIMLDLINFVKKMPKGGNTKSIDYVNDPTFKGMMAEYESEKKFYIDPSETKRQAGTICSW